MNDAFRRTALFGLDLDYHFSDTLAIGGSVHFGAAFDSALKERLNAERPNRVKAGGFSHVQTSATVELTYTPIFGKLAFLGRKVFDYDAHFLIGAGVAMLAGSPDVEGIAPMGVLGVGAHIFIDRTMAVTLQLRDQIYSSALNAVARVAPDGERTISAESEVRNNFLFTIGYSFMFPRIPKVSN